MQRIKYETINYRVITNSLSYEIKNSEYSKL